jgi:hypothetical protein
VSHKNTTRVKAVLAVTLIASITNERAGTEGINNASSATSCSDVIDKLLLFQSVSTQPPLSPYASAHNSEERQCLLKKQKNFFSAFTVSHEH